MYACTIMLVCTMSVLSLALEAPVTKTNSLCVNILGKKAHSDSDVWEPDILRWTWGEETGKMKVGEDKEDPDVLCVKKFYEICLPEQNMIINRHAKTEYHDAKT